jgi:hypothetical protein
MKTTSYSHAILSATAAALLAACGAMDPASTPAGERITLSGASEVPPVSTSATGSGTVSVSADCSVTADVRVSGMTATAAHIHQAAPGANGPVVVPFTKAGDNAFTAPAGSKLNEAACAAYKRGETYVNVHSAAHPNGEVRAQLKGR